MIKQFFSINEDYAYCSGWAFHCDAEAPEGDWVEVYSRKRVSLPVLRKKAKALYQLQLEEAVMQEYYQ